MDTGAVYQLATLAALAKPDAFDAHPTARYAGRRFAVAAPIFELGDATNTLRMEASGDAGEWTYDRDAGQLTVSFYARNAEGYSLSYSRQLIGSHVGYVEEGPRGKVRISRFRRLEVVLIDRDFRADANNRSASIDASPAEARRLSHDLVTIFQGTLVADGDDDATARCDSDFFPAYGRAEEVVGTECQVFVRFEQISLYDTGRHVVLATWKVRNS